MNLNMTVMTNYKRFSAPCCHYLHPDRLFFPAFDIQIRKFTNVMYFNILCTSAQFTLIRKQPLYQFGSAAVNFVWSIIYNCVFLMCQRNTAPLCCQRLFALSFNNNFKAFQGFPCSLVYCFGFVFITHFLNTFTIRAMNQF